MRKTNTMTFKITITRRDGVKSEHTKVRTFISLADTFMFGCVGQKAPNQIPMKDIQRLEIDREP